MAFISSDIYPKWKGNLLVALKVSICRNAYFTGDKITGRQKIATDVGRLRNILQGPDGYIFGVEGKGILKNNPKL
jgi:glucose/arabinose dehydrogenase